MASCFMIGHRECTAEILPWIMAAAERLVVHENVDTFFVGHYGGFDRVAAIAIREIKQRYPQVRLLMVLPYHPAERPKAAPSWFDGTYYPADMERVPRRYAIVQANRRMIDVVAFVLGAVRHPASNAKSILEYAARQGKQIINVLDGEGKN